MADKASAVAGQKRRRTKSGCLNCRRKRKKCKSHCKRDVLRYFDALHVQNGSWRLADFCSGDEQRPTCLRCEKACEQCNWDGFIKFRPPTGLSGSRESDASRPVTLSSISDSDVRLCLGLCLTLWSHMADLSCRKTGKLQMSIFQASIKTTAIPQITPSQCQIGILLSRNLLDQETLP